MLADLPLTPAYIVTLTPAVYRASIARIAEEWSPAPSAVFGELLVAAPVTDRPARFAFTGPFRERLGTNPGAIVVPADSTITR